MSIGPSNWAASVTGSQASQSRGVDSERRSVDSASQLAAADAASRGAVDGSLQENESAQDRDADGRDLTGRDDGQAKPSSEDEKEDSDQVPPCSRDASGTIGRNLDLSG